MSYSMFPCHMRPLTSQASACCVNDASVAVQMSFTQEPAEPYCCPFHGGMYVTMQAGALHLLPHQHLLCFLKVNLMLCCVSQGRR